MKTCPNCKSKVDKAAEVCGCGHWFRSSPTTAAPTAAHEPVASAPAPKQGRRREWLVTGGLLVVGLIVGLGLAQVLRGEKPAAKDLSPGLKADMSSAESLRAVAEMFNQDLPRKVSADVRLDRVTSEPGQLVMAYTLLERTAANTSASDLEAAFRDKLTATYCQENASRLVRQAGIAIAHRYSGSDGTGVGELRVTPESCRGAQKK